MPLIVCCQAVNQNNTLYFCKELLKKSAWEKLSFFPKARFFSALFFQILSVYDIARRIKRFAPIKRHDIVIDVIHHVDVVILGVAARVRAGHHVIQRQQGMTLGSGSCS